MNRTKGKKVSVVIPYFQRKAGLLTEALRSVRKQTAFARIDRVIVIDDGSPRPAEQDIESLIDDAVLMDKLYLIKQQNRGVSGARNRGLDSVGVDVEYVSFLDPDDIWLPVHLESALAALDRGSDFHFSNFTHIGQTVGAFERAGYLDPKEHEVLIQPDIHHYCGNMVEQITTANVIGTTSVTYRFANARKVRFSEQYTFAGEDYLMWLALINVCPKISFTSSITAHCGEGINLFSGAAWGSRHLCDRLLDEINYRTYLLEHVTMQTNNRQQVKKKLYDNRQAYIRNALSMFKRADLLSLPLIIKHMLKNKNLRRLLLKRVK